jgi:hypothetical protein
MSAPNSPQQKFFFALLGAAACLLLAFPLVKLVADPGPPDAGADETTTTTTALAPVGSCGTDQVFFSRATEGNQFGPAAPEDPANVAATQADFASRRCQDAALMVADSEYLFNEFSDAPTRVQKTVDLMSSQEAWLLSEFRFQSRLNEATMVEIAEMSGSYQTMDMEDKGRTIPEIYQVPVEAAPFKVLRYTWPDGTVKNFKLNCGFQPVDQQFPPSVPGVGAPPAPNQPSAPPTPTSPSKPGQPGKPEQPTTPTTPTTTWKCTPERMADGVCGSGGNNHPSQVVPEPLPPTPGYEPGGAEGSASDPGDGVFVPPGGSMSPGSTTGGGGTETGGTTGFGDIAPTEATPQPVNPPGDPGAPA